MARVVIFVTFIYGAWRWGDWRNWKKYYPTILFFILCSFYYISIYDNYPLWKLEPLPPLDHILSNSTFISIAVAVIVNPCTALIYLGHYPKGKKQLLYVLLWVAIYTLIEVVMLFQHGISYHHGWALGWSVVFDLLTFFIIRLHFLYPMAAWAFIPVIAAIFGYIFGFPTNQ